MKIQKLREGFSSSGNRFCLLIKGETQNRLSKPSPSEFKAGEGMQASQADMMNAQKLF